MKRQLAIAMLGGRLETAAKWLRCTPHSISNWAVDAEDNLTSARVRDSVVAALVRKLAQERLARGEQLHAHEAALLDLPTYVQP